jgi:redox-sensing transcriptional repressor
VLAVPDGVDVRKVDLSIELQILAYHEQRKAQGAGAVAGVAEVADVAEPTPGDGTMTGGAA